MKKSILLFILLSILLTATHAQKVTIEDTKTSYSLKGKCLYYLDLENLTFDQLLEKQLTPSYTSEWYKQEAYYWISFEIDNQSSVNDFILTIDQWQEVEFYYQESGQWEKTLSGTILPIVERPESLHRLLTLPLRIPKNSTAIYYLKVRNTTKTLRYYQSVYDFLSKLELQFAAPGRSKYILNQVVISFVLGLCFALILFIGVRIFLKPQAELVFLFWYIIITGVFIANIHGVATNYLFSWTQSFEMDLGIVLVHISSILIALYVRAFLKTKGWELENILLLTMAGIMAVSLMYAWVDNQPHWYYWRRYAEGVILAITLLIAIYKKKANVYLLLAAFFFALCGRYTSEYLSKFNLFVWGDIPYLVGFMLQLTLFTIASSVKMDSLEKEFSKTLMEKQQLLEGQNRKLNEQVELRTSEMRQANEELKNTIQVLKGTQQRLIETENMAVIGRISGGLAHELNNPLNVIGGMVRPIKTNLIELKSEGAMQSPSSEELYEEIMELLQGVETASNKATEVVKNLGNITPSSRYQKRTPVDLVELIKDLIAPIQLKYPSITFQLDFSESLTVDCWPDEFGKMLENIILNAIDAISESENGTITVSLKKENQNLLLSITDNGIGMDAGVLRHAFEPFFTTKTPGMGTGLGLFISKTIAYKHGGNIRATSEPGNGSSFQIVLPLNNIA